MAKPNVLKLALVGAETLLGRELKEVLESSGADLEITGYSATGEGNFGEEEGEAVFIRPLDGSAVEEHTAILLAGSREGSRKALELAKAAPRRPLVIDCTGDLDNEPEARIVAPDLDAGRPEGAWLVVLAHPAAVALARTLAAFATEFTVRQVVAHVFEPASERGKRGLSELHRQTTSLLSFKPLDKAVFDAQLSFNLLSQYGEEAPLKLSAVEQRIERDLATLLARPQFGSKLPMPSLRLVQAPVFHGYSISVWIEFAGDVNVGGLVAALESAHIDVRGEAEEAPNSVGAAGQSGLSAGDIRRDPNDAHAAWVWVVGDNLRLMADAAVGVLTTAQGAGA